MEGCIAVTEIRSTHCKIIDLGKFRLDREEKQSKGKKKSVLTCEKTSTEDSRIDRTIEREG
jgi:translation initiation factor IF-3